MNKRIQELIEQATESPVFPANIGYFNREKFAELIIKECIRVPYNMWDKAELNADIAVKIENRIKEHFGVEE